MKSILVGMLIDGELCVDKREMKVYDVQKGILPLVAKMHSFLQYSFYLSMRIVRGPFIINKRKFYIPSHLFLCMKDVGLSKKWMILSVISVVVLVARVFGASVVLEFPICTQGSAQNPAIYGNVVVWEDNRNGNGKGDNHV